MPNIVTKTFSNFVSDMAAAIQGSASALTNFAVGSVLLAISQATAGVAIWLESLILILLQTTRLSTSSGNDVDTFLADFGDSRLQATQATGQVAFSRFTATNAAYIYPGQTVQTADSTQNYTVIADTTQSAWNATLAAYVIPAGISSAVATVQAVNTGTQGNVAANTITTITSAIPYVDTVTNANPLIDGQNAESDAAAKTGFVAYIASLARATLAAIMNAVTSLQSGATCNVIEWQLYNGTVAPGYFYAVVDDGSGDPSSTFLNSAGTAIDGVRACGIQFAVFAPAALTANVSLTIAVGTGFVLATVETAVQAAIETYINSIELGQTCFWSQIYAVAWGVQGVTNASSLLLNGGTSNLVPTSQQRIIAGTITVN